MAADELEELLDIDRLVHRWQQDAEEERRAKETERRTQLEREAAEAAEQDR